MNLSRNPLWTVGIAVAAALLVGCDGSKPKDGGGPGGSELRLQSVEMGRLVDVYAYRRVNRSNGQRRDVGNRQPVLIARDVVVDPRIESQELFDPVGEEDPNADFQFRPFDVDVGHEELLILWDDSHADEQARFEDALGRATSGLVAVPPAFQSQNTTVQPIPVVPRNAALKLKFTRTLGVDSSFFAANPAALQVLEIVDDPETVIPQRAFRTVPYRVLVQGETLVIDPSLVGGESRATGKISAGLPTSRDNVAANIRLAIPTQVAGGGLGIKADQVAQLNGADRTGLPAVIRDFRTGNPRDGRVGILPDIDKPMIVADVAMGITAVDEVNNVLTLNKRFARVAVRGRVPFVVGPLAATSDLPLGPTEVPTVAPLRSGDFVVQTVRGPNGPVRLRAEVVMNLDVSNRGTLTANPNLGRAADGSDGGSAQVVRVKVASVRMADGAGGTVSFAASDLPLGADCTVRVHYYENVPYTDASFAVSDGGRREEFMVFDPATPRIDPQTRVVIPPGTRIDPSAAVMVRMSEPMDLESVDRSGNFMLATRLLPDSEVLGVLDEAKPIGLSLIATNFEDFQQDGTVLRLNSPVGLTHQRGTAERYWLHLLAESHSPQDLAGNGVDLFDRRTGTEQRKCFSVNFSLNEDAGDNLVASRLIRFESTDEDGTKPGAPDFFGQFELRDGQLLGAPVQRFGRVADNINIANIMRGDKNDCFFEGTPMQPMVPGTPGGHLTWGPLYTTQSMVQTTAPLPPPIPFQPPQTPIFYGGIGGPHNPRGVREMVSYREEDFELGYTDASTMLIDVEQMHWSPWLNQPVIFDQFDRYTLRMGHSHKRPDLRVVLVQPQMAPPYCGVDCASLFSGLELVFDNNPLNGAMTEVVKDKAYTINPAESFQADTGNVFTPYPKFQRTFTWRDSRLVNWDRGLEQATGLGGAVNPTTNTVPPKDNTVSVSSPWEQDIDPEGFIDTMGTRGPIPPPSGVNVADVGDFNGDRQRDHDPIALPLLVEFNLWPDEASNGVVKGTNRMHIGYVGINGHQSPFWGYFNLGRVPPPPASPVPHWANQDPSLRAGSCGGLEYPYFTVMTAGSVDAAGVQTLIDPTLQRTARGTTILDAGSTDMTNGLTAVPPGNDHLYWTQMDFVRRVSMVTFGFFDPLKPNQHALDPSHVRGTWSGITVAQGEPNLANDPDRRVEDLVAIMDPPLEAQPAGTSVRLEVRGVERIGGTFSPKDGIWEVKPNPRDNISTERENLLNPLYACDAFRYAMANPSSNANQSVPRVEAGGLTPYADLENLDRLRDPLTGLLPRYINFRLVFENDVNRSAPKRPGLRSLGLAFRVRAP